MANNLIIEVNNDEWCEIVKVDIYKILSYTSQSDICSICLESCTHITKCHHHFHHNCLREYIKKSNNKTCPYCRTVLS